VELREYPLILDQVGTVRTQAQAQVSSRILAQVKEILVREGDSVKGPDETGGHPTVLARLDDRDIRAKLRRSHSQLKATKRALEAARARLEAARARVEAARAQRTQALSDYQRYEQLYRTGAATGQKLEHARAQKETAEAQFRAAQQEVEAIEREILQLQAQAEQAQAAVTESQVLLSHTVITAPFSGRVVRKEVEVGDMVGPGQVLFLLETPSHPELHAIVSESLLPHISVGQDLEVYVDALHRTLEGRVREIVPRADPATRTVLVKVALPPREGLVSGLFGRLRVPYGRYETLVVPKKCVRSVGQLHLVDVRGPDGHPTRRFVTLGEVHNEMVEVLSGLKEGEEVALP
jgi:multidrug resistance efflux pump